jgi:hypothetical protein
MEVNNMKIKVITSYTTEIEQTWEVSDNTDLDRIIALGLPAEAKLVSETNILGNDYYGEITEVRRIKE